MERTVTGYRLKIMKIIRITGKFLKNPKLITNN